MGHPFDYSVTNKPFLSVTGVQAGQVRQPYTEGYWTQSEGSNLFAGKTVGLMGAGSPLARKMEGLREPDGFEPTLRVYA